MSQSFSDIRRLIVGLEGHLAALKQAVAHTPETAAPGRLQPANETVVLSEARYRLLVESVQDFAIIMLDPQGRIASWNFGAERIKGYTAEEIIGRPMQLFYTPVDALDHRPQMLLAKAAELGHVEDEGWRLRKDGTRFWANVVITALRDDDGELVGYAKVTRDLTERRKADEQRRQFELLVTSVVDYAILMVDPRGRISSWNKGAERLKGYVAEEIIGEPYTRFFLPEDVAAGKPQALLKMARELGHVEDEGWRVRKDGTRFWADAVITAVYDLDGELVGYAKVTRDLTERRQADALKDQFLSILSHELRTPLNAILGFGSFLEEEMVGDLNDEQRRYINRILGSADALLALIDDLLDMSRIQAGKFSIHKEAVNFPEVVTHVFESLGVLADQKQITLVHDVPTSLPRFHADRQRLGQVVMNLLSNAIKFSPPGRTVAVSAEVDDDTLRCRVVDEGIGIAPEHLPRLFIPFSQVDSSNTRQAGGAGLGLSIVKALVDAHGGTVGVESVLHEGSAFWFTVPLEPVPVNERRCVINQVD